MGEVQAEALAVAIGGETWQSGCGIWLKTVGRGDGSLVVFSDDAVCEYANEDAFEAENAKPTIQLVTAGSLPDRRDR